MELVGNATDNRLNKIEGIPSRVEDCDEAFRAICGHFKIGVTKAREFSKVNNPKSVHPRHLAALCQETKSRFVLDTAIDKFEIYYQDFGQEPFDLPGEDVQDSVDNEEVRTDIDLKEGTYNDVPEVITDGVENGEQGELPEEDGDESDDLPFE